VAGNARYVKQKAHGCWVSNGLRKQLAKGQHPFAIIVTCSDSRVGPEIVFDQTLGDLFVVRCAGELVDDYGLGSIEYGIEHLGVALVVVMGHESCGAVKAATESPDAPGYIGALVRAIRPAVEAAHHAGDDTLDGAVKENTRMVTEKVRKDVEKGEVKVVAAHFNLHTGAVEFLK